ncbi:hypothetical protein X773_29370 [Mesorhizobium sp. LSJC285A00]|nr:hypothetical protein X773_29370 [Mesorhizobium sp. LSJC285A00]
MTTTAASEKIGFIGLGLMGHGIAKNIVDKGYGLTFLGRKNRKPAEDLIGRGAKEAATSRDVAAASDIVFICVTGSREVEAIIRGPGGLKEGLKKGSVVVDCSTADPVSTVALAAELKEIGFGRRRLLDRRSGLDGGAGGGTEGDRRRLRRCTAQPHPEGSLGRHARRHGRRARRAVCPCEAGHRDLGRPHRPYWRHR